MWSSEIDPFCIALTAQLFPDVEQLGDIKKLDAEKVTPVDIVCAGSPCQDLSVAGKQTGLKGERSGLLLRAIEFVRRMRMSTGGAQPRWFIWENVPGAFSSNAGSDFRTLLEKISQTEIPVPRHKKWAYAGMVRSDECDIAWRLLNAEFFGVAQRRRRVFLVADFGATGRCAGRCLFERKMLHRDSQKRKQEETGVAGSAGNSTATASRIRCLNPDYPQAWRCYDPAGKMCSLPAREGHGGEPGNVMVFGFSTGASVADSNPVYEGKTPCMRTTTRLGVCETYCISGQMVDRETTMNGNGVTANKACTLTATDRHAVCIGNGQTHQTYFMDKAGALNTMHDQQCVFIPDKARALLAKHNMCYRYDEDTLIKQSSQRAKCVRRLTCRECERLQGLPDDWTLINHKTCNKSARYRALGNGMAQPVPDFILLRLVEALENENRPDF